MRSRSIAGSWALLVVASFWLVTGCASPKPLTLGERVSGYTYIPLDPFPVVPNWECQDGGAAAQPDSENARLLAALPDNAVRIMTTQRTAAGSVSVASSTASAEATAYRVTIDYINADTVSMRLWIRKWARAIADSSYYQVSIVNPLEGAYVSGSDYYEVTADEQLGSDRSEEFEEIILPLYVGVGLRATADITVLKAEANISGLGIIGSEAELGRVDGSLTLQTLGVNGQMVAAALPVQSELNRTTAENAITAIASIKSQLYAEGVTLQPRVVGMYLPLPADVRLVNAIVSEIANWQIDWEPSCQAAS